MTSLFSEKKLHKISQIDQIAGNYFVDHPTLTEVYAKSLMYKFIGKGIFFKNYSNGLPIRQLLNQLDEADKLDLFKQVRVIRNVGNRNWYFKKQD